MGDILIVRAFGTPRPQGSKRHGAQGQMLEASSGLKHWRETVQLAAMRARSAVLQFGGGTGPWATIKERPVSVERRFYLERPAVPEHELYPLGPPDEDKLARATNDALTAAGVWADDALVVHSITTKRWATGSAAAFPEAPGVWMKIEVLD